MKRKMPQIREYMTKAPKIIEVTQTLETAQSLMHQMGVRHLPVEKEGTLVGILSERNTTAALLTKQGAQFTVADVMMPNPYVVAPECELDLVVAAMAEEKYGSAIVQDGNGKVIGIFTTIDACRAFCQVLETVFPQ